MKRGSEKEKSKATILFLLDTELKTKFSVWCAERNKKMSHILVKHIKSLVG